MKGRKNDIPFFEKYVLVSSAFGFYNNIVSKNLNEDEYWAKQSSNHLFIEEFKKNYEYQKNLFNKYLDGIKKLILAYPEIFFVVRPHPVESVDYYHKYFKTHQNGSPL